MSINFKECGISLPTLVYLIIGDDIDKINGMNVFITSYYDIFFYCVDKYFVIEDENNYYCSCNYDLEHLCDHILRILLDKNDLKYAPIK